jgi:3-hydroxyisobutyrate dehydrogenase
MRVGFIGLGHQGLPIAHRIAEAGLEPVVWARRPEAIDPIRHLPITIASSPADLASRCDVIGLCLFDAAGLDLVVFGTDGIAAAMQGRGHLVVHSTVAPEEIVALANRAHTHGIAVLDAPVSGGPEPTYAGELVVIVGGDPGVLEHCRPMIETYSNRIIHVGDVGTAQLAKLVNNVIFTANLGIAADGLRVADELGLDPAGFREVVQACTARSAAMDSTIMLGTFETLANTNATPTLSKDVALFEAQLGRIDPGILLTTAATLTAHLRQAREG